MIFIIISIFFNYKGLSNIYLVETVKSVEIANKLNNATIKNKKPQMNIMLQINTSGEERRII